MTPEQNFKNMNSRINSYIEGGENKGKATIIFMGNMGGVGTLHVTLESCELTKYAQYNNALRLTFRKKGGRSVYELIRHEGQSFAVFEGWHVSLFEHPASWTCFDRNLFYRTVDAMDCGDRCKLGEESERFYLAERTAKPKIYEVVTMNADGFHRAEFGSVEELGAAFEVVGKHSNPNITRAELQGAPLLKGLCGPMYNGEQNGAAVIRYEGKSVYEMMSN